MTAEDGTHPVRGKGEIMDIGRCIRTLVAVALVATGTHSQAAMRARSLAETVLEDAHARISAGEHHTCQVKEDGTVRCWGINDRGQLGRGTASTVEPTPAAVSGLVNVVAVAAGDRHTCAVLADGSVRCWGFNSSGQLGDGTITQSTIPIIVPGLIDAVAIAAGSAHTCALRVNGTVVCWGSNSNGQIGDGTLTVKRTPTAVVSLANVTALALGSLHSCARQADGTVSCWGSNQDDQLGIASNQTNALIPVKATGVAGAVEITAKSSTTCALQDVGTVRCWGRNNAGQLGDGTTARRKTSVAVSGLFGVTGISSAGVSTCALLANGTVRCWGGNANGQLGDGTLTDRLTPTVAVSGLANTVAVTGGSAHACALQADGGVRCWGFNAFGSLGNGTLSPSAVPVAVLGGGGSFTALDIAAGNAHTCAVRAFGGAACWGLNAFGEVGDGTTALLRLLPASVAGSVNTVAVATGSAHSCSLQADGTVRCWGLNDDGQIGDGTRTTRRAPVAVGGLVDVIAITAGSVHTCALQADGRVKCWGGNRSGQIGDGTNTTSPLTPVPVTGLLSAVAIAAGAVHTCALTSSGRVFCWGSNVNGRLGDGTQTDRFAPVLVPTLINAVAIAPGGGHTCALLANGTAQCWGDNSSRQLGDGTTTLRTTPTTVSGVTNAVALATGSEHSCVITSGGIRRCWGSNAFGQLGEVVFSNFTIGILQSPTATQIAAGDFHTCVVSSSGGVSCWGFNGQGQIGDGTLTDRGSPVTVPSFGLNIDTRVSLGRDDRSTIVTILAVCSEDQWLHVDVVLRQGDVSGHGTAEGRCTGGLERYPVMVSARGHDLAFLEGPAEVEAEGIIRGPSGFEDPQSWTRRVEIVNNAN